MNNKANFFESDSTSVKENQLMNICELAKIPKNEPSSLENNLKTLKTLVLDLDETLVHTSFSKLEVFNHIVKVVIKRLILRKLFSMYMCK